MSLLSVMSMWTVNDKFHFVASLLFTFLNDVCSAKRSACGRYSSEFLTFSPSCHEFVCKIERAQSWLNETELWMNNFTMKNYVKISFSLILFPIDQQSPKWVDHLPKNRTQKHTKYPFYRVCLCFTKSEKLKCKKEKSISFCMKSEIRFHRLFSLPSQLSVFCAFLSLASSTIHNLMRTSTTRLLIPLSCFVPNNNNISLSFLQPSTATRMNDMLSYSFIYSHFIFVVGCRYTTLWFCAWST